MKKDRILNRKRINSILSTVYDYPLTILEAPMGFGKTTAVKMFVESEKITPVWIAFKKSGDSATAFWDRFIGQIILLDPQIGEAIKSLGFPADAPQLEKLLLLMNKVNFPDKTLLILDDYQFARNTQLGKLILLLAEEEMEGLHILLLTRDTTDIGFVELLSKGLCNIITRRQLGFNDSEIVDYCHMMSENLSDSDIKKICEYTEGWISFIYIFILGLEQGIPLGINTTVEDLIERALFDCYDKTVQNFLLKLSLMDEFTVQQAEYVTQNKNTAALLKNLNKENAFVFYDETDKKYKIHNVLLDFLRLKQNFSDIVLKELYLNLGEWYYQNNEFMAAYAFLYKAGYTEQILAYLNLPSNIRDELTQFEGADELFRYAPRELLFKYPLAYLQYIFFSLVTDEENNILELKARLGELEQFYKTLSDIEDSYRNRILGEILIVRKFTLFNHLEEIKASNNKIMELLDGQNSYIAIQDNSFTFGSPHYIYLYFRDVGGLKKIAGILSEEVGYAKFSNGCGTGCDSLALAEYALETGDFEHVEINCEQARVKAEIKAQISVVICSIFTLIRYSLLEGKISEALELLKSLEQRAAKANIPLINTTLDLCRGYVYASLCQPEKVPVWLQTGDMSVADLVYEGVAFNYLVFGKTVLASKKYTELEVLTELFDKRFSEFSNQLGFIHNGIFKAAAKFKLYGMEAGVYAMEKVLSEAEQDHIIMPFAEAAPYIIDMLEGLHNKYSDNAFIKQVLVYSRKYCDNICKIGNNPVPLSKREISIISLLAQGLSRKQISEQLCISQETAKTHLKNIYIKLDVSGKTAAIKTAQLHGLI